MFQTVGQQSEEVHEEIKNESKNEFVEKIADYESFDILSNKLSNIFIFG